MSHRQARKTPRTVPPAVPADRAKEALALCIDTQAQLNRVQELSRKWEDHRRDAVRTAFQEGIDAGQIAAALKISRAKVYQLLGSVRMLKG